LSIKRRQVHELAERKPVSNVYIITVRLWKTTPKKHLRFLKTKRIIGVSKRNSLLHELAQLGPNTTGKTS